MNSLICANILRTTRAVNAVDMFATGTSYYSGVRRAGNSEASYARAATRSDVQERSRAHDIPSRTIPAANMVRRHRAGFTSHRTGGNGMKHPKPYCRMSTGGLVLLREQTNSAKQHEHILTELRSRFADTFDEWLNQQLDKARSDQDSLTIEQGDMT